MLLLERLLQQWVLFQIQHAQAEIERGMEEPSELVHLILLQWLAGDGRARLAVDGPLVLARREIALCHFRRHSELLLQSQYAQVRVTVWTATRRGAKWDGVVTLTLRLSWRDAAG